MRAAVYVPDHLSDHAHLDLPATGRMILRLLEKLQYGALRLRTPDGSILLYGDGSHPVTLDLHNWRLCSAVLRSGDIGFAETFIAGDWRTDNLPGLIELMIRNRAQIESLIYGNWWGNLIYKVRHLLQPQFARRQQEEYPRPLRHRQRLLSAVAGPVDDVFERAV